MEFTMARITIEDCLEHVSDHFALIHLTAKRYRQLHKNNSKPLVESKNKPVVTALREIAAGKVVFREDVSGTMNAQAQEVNEQRRRSQRLDALVHAGKLNPHEQ
jgi:DNA-directed RNA polymerase subunit omega